MRILAPVLIAILAVAVLGALVLWRRVDIAIPVIGWVAIGIGAALTLLLAAGLMGLAFYSARHGFDDRHPPDDPP